MTLSPWLHSCTFLLFPWHHIGYHGNSQLRYLSLFKLDRPYTFSGHSREFFSRENSFFIIMATVVKVTIPQYFSYYQGPMTNLCAKFWQDRSKNEEKIMSTTTALYEYDEIIILPAALCWSNM